MNLNISYQNKDAAKAAFRAANIPLTWNSAAKRWQTSAKDLPRSLWIYSDHAPELSDAERPCYRAPNMDAVHAHNKRIVAAETGKTVAELDAEDREFDARRAADADATIKAAGGWKAFLASLEC